MNNLTCLLILVLGFLHVQIRAQESTTYLASAKEMAVKENKKILMVFSGSDWCKPCILLKREILSSEKFQQSVASKLVHLELDFPYQKKNKLDAEQLAQNESLAELYNSEGSFPKSLILDTDENVLGEIYYSKGMGIEKYIEQIESILK